LPPPARADDNPDKVDLTVGIYMDEQGLCPVFDAVREAQRALFEEETSKAYLPPAGVAAFNTGMQSLVLGADSDALAAGRVSSSIQAPGGCGALRIGAEVVQAAAPGAKVWVSDPDLARAHPAAGQRRSRVCHLSLLRSRHATA
jgi:aspartate aminotransferase